MERREWTRFKIIPLAKGKELETNKYKKKHLCIDADCTQPTASAWSAGYLLITSAWSAIRSLANCSLAHTQSRQLQQSYQLQQPSQLYGFKRRRPLAAGAVSLRVGDTTVRISQHTRLLAAGAVSLRGLATLSTKQSAYSCQVSMHAHAYAYVWMSLNILAIILTFHRLVSFHVCNKVQVSFHAYTKFIEVSFHSCNKVQGRNKITHRFCKWRVYEYMSDE